MCMCLTGHAFAQASLELQMEQKAAVVQLLLDFRQQQAHTQAEQQRLYQGLSKVTPRPLHALQEHFKPNVY